MNEIAVMLSIRPKWCYLIANGNKTIEIRKSKPRIKPPFRCYIYQTKSKHGDWNARNGRVIGEFVCKELFPIKVLDNGCIQNYNFHCMKNSCVSYDDIANYIGTGCTGYGWNITNLALYDQPKEITEFFVESDVTNDSPMLVKMKRPPQSWCYVEGRAADAH